MARYALNRAVSAVMSNPSAIERIAGILASQQSDSRRALRRRICTDRASLRAFNSLSRCLGIDRLAPFRRQPLLLVTN